MDGGALIFVDNVQIRERLSEQTRDDPGVELKQSVGCGS